MKKMIYGACTLALACMLMGCGAENKTNDTATVNDEVASNIADDGESVADNENVSEDSVLSGDEDTVNETDTSNGAESVNNTDTSRGTESANNTDTSNGTESANNIDTSNETEPANNTDTSNGTESANDVDTSNETDTVTDTSEDYYSVCTSLSKSEVEGFAATVRQQIIDGDYTGLAENIAYPITIDGTVCNSVEDFNSLDIGSKISDAFKQSITDESCVDMFCNYQGIMLGNGEVWISEILDDDLSSKGLKIIAINP